MASVTLGYIVYRWSTQKVDKGEQEEDAKQHEVIE